tara:strand:- start:1901 stop:2518 length:618 start_codon:yes stop_codon:yes gene_type:complete
MDSSYWFYTLSAIPQTLGAIIALTAAFVVFKLDRINDSLSSHYHHFKIILRAIREDKHIPTEDNWEEYNSLFYGTTKTRPVLDIDNSKWIKVHCSELIGAYKIIEHHPYIDSLGSDKKEKLLHYWFKDQRKGDFQRKWKHKETLLLYLGDSLSLIASTIIFCLAFLPFFDVLNEYSRSRLVLSSVMLASASLIVTMISIRGIVRL